ncbi:iron complex transport system permease protein [Leucobacter luti]|uniref:Iron complex transport system permease protein n=1 Tax=Leucobacter luti TaxID=340320 RepID=A0A4R6RV39_9MICO|nr:iron ABC transporter permease [Leucobacter luti]TDP90165.1 iron complex transport system permease protein [Leucobacter luti]
MTAAALVSGRRRRTRRRWIAITALATAVLAGFALSLMLGRTVTPPQEVWAVLTGQSQSGAAFTVGELRLPRATLAVLAGFAFGIAGATFQTLLGNPLASPDILGVTSGAGAAAVFGILVLGLNESATSLIALGGALATAAAIFLLANRGGFAGMRFILIGIGLAAILQSVTSYLLSRAAEWDMQRAMQWLTGSLTGATWAQVLPLALASVVLLPVLLWHSRDLELLRLGTDTAQGLGVSVGWVRIVLIVAAVALLAFATAACGPVMFVAFMAGPIAARVVGSGGSLLLPAGLMGALLVLVSDHVGQFLLGGRTPVGVVTGVLGAPTLIFLLIQLNRKAGA